MGKIYIESRAVGGTGGIGRHLYLVYQDDQNMERVIRGDSEHVNVFDLDLDIKVSFSRFDNPPIRGDVNYDLDLIDFGKLVLQIDFLLEDSLDHNNVPEPTAREQRGDAVLPTPEYRGRREIPLGGRSAEEVWQEMKCIAWDIHIAGIKYDFINDNSNSTIRTLLRETGVAEILPWNALSPLTITPGWGTILPVPKTDEDRSLYSQILCSDEEHEDEPSVAPQRGRPDVNKDPLALDLDGDGVETVGLSANIHFDHDGDSFKELSGAIAADDGLLVLDINGDGQIDSGAELFGNNTLLADGTLAAHGFVALAELDSNSDGIIDDKDSRYSELRIWRDLDQDGETDDGELFILEDVGVQSLNTAYSEQTDTDASGNEHRQVGSYTTTSGEVRTMTDVWFTSNPTLTQEEIIAVSSEISVLPDIAGYGRSRSLHQAMARDESGKLQSLVEDFVAASARQQRLALTEQIIFAWTGQEGEYRHHFQAPIDARRMGALEVFYGHEMERPRRNLGQYTSAFTGVFNDIAAAIFARLSARSHLAPFFRVINWSENAETGLWEGDFGDVVVRLFEYTKASPVDGQDIMQDFSHAVRGIDPYNTVNVERLRAAVGEFIATSDLSGYTDATIGIVGSAVLNASEGTDRIDGNNGNNFLFGFGGNDEISGMGGNDVLDGGAGNDVLDGGSGDDEYRFGRGYGHDRIRNTDAGVSRNNIVRLIGGLNKEDISITRQGDDLLIAINDSEDILRVESHFDGEETAGTARRYINAIVFDDDSKLAVGPSQFDALNIASQSITEENDELHGSSAADILDGLAGNDKIYGKAGNDTLTGSAGDDQLYGDAGVDTLAGDAGDDVLEGGTGADTLLGGADNDQLYGEAGNDTLTGGEGADTLVGGLGNDSYRFNLGDGLDVIDDRGSTSDSDKIVLGTGIVSEDTIIRRSGNDLTIIIREGTDAIRVKNYYANAVNRIASLVFEDETSAEASWDRAELERLADTATAKDDELHGDATANSIDGLAGDDLLIGYGGKDVLTGGAGDDTLEGGEGADTLEGGLDHDVLKGGDGGDSYKIVADGSHDIIQDNGSHVTDIDKIIFAEGITQADISYSRTATDLVITINKDDALSTVTIKNSFRDRHNQIEQLVFSDGTTISIATALAAVDAWTGTDAGEVIYGDVANDRLDGGGGNDRLRGEGGDDHLSGGADNDTIHGGADHDHLYGNGGNDYLYGEGGNDELEGGSGNDRLFGGADHDVLDGGTGSDILYGGTGNDTYLFSRGDGSTFIRNDDVDVGSRDVLRLEGINVEEVTATRSPYGDDLRLTVKGGDGGAVEVITVNRFFADSQYQLDAIEFTDGTDIITTWDTAKIKELVLVTTQGDDYIAGSVNNDNFDGLGGNDQLYGGAGNDTLRGGAGDDRLYGEAGDDTYVFDRGDGKTSIYNNDVGEGRRDILRFLAGINPSDVTAARSYYDLRLKVRSTDGSAVEVITVRDFFRGSRYEINAVEFSDGTDTDISTVWDPAKLKALVLVPTEGADYIKGSVEDNIFDGLGGNDQLYGGGGKDTLSGGADHDTLRGDAGNDVLDGGAGNDRLSGGDGDDELRGGTGRDTLSGGAGNDIYFFGRGDGKTTINNYDAGEGRKDIVRFLAGINPGDVTATRRDGDLQLTVQDGADESSIEVITVSSFFADSRYEINAVEFSDGTDTDIGTVWDSAKVRELVLAVTEVGDYISGYSANDIIDSLGGADTLRGGAGNDRLSGGADDDHVYGGTGDDHVYGNADNDTLYGDAGNDVLDGGAGRDALFGGAGNDELRGGSGNDRLDGGVGDDIYFFGRGDGNTTIYNNDVGKGRKDVLRFLEGINPGDVTAARLQNSDLQLTIASVDGSAVEVITVRDFFRGSRYEINAVEFSDSTDTDAGTVWDIGKIRELVLVPTEDADYIIGSDHDDIIDGSGGHDVLIGGAGNDELRGGSGNDRLDGGSGDDTYLFGRGDGRATIYNNDADVGRKDVLRFLAGINPRDVTAVRRGSDLQLELRSGDGIAVQVVTVNRFFQDSRYEINAVEFSDGTDTNVATVWDSDKLKALVLVATHGNDYLVGSDHDDTIGGLGGFDILYGGAGNDSLFGGANTDIIRGEVGDDLLDGGTGHDFLYGGSGDDELRGSFGNDDLSGGAGDDELRGGLGNDKLYGGTGNDTYFFGRGDGRTTINNYDTGEGRKDILRFLAGINPNDVRAARLQNSDLRLTVQNADENTVEVITVNRFFNGSRYELDAIEFSDGTGNEISTVWDSAKIRELILMPTEGADYLFGSVEDNTLDGLGGNDALYGGEGHDTLRGGTGDDALYGDLGNDILRGGTGNDDLYGGAGDDTLRGDAGYDELYGGAGNDSYLFGRGDGSTIIRNADAGEDRKDVLRFLAGINPGDVTATRRDSDLQLTVQDGADESTVEVITVSGFFWRSSYAINAVEFSDGTDNAIGTVWDPAKIKKQALIPTAANDYIVGSVSNEIFDGLGGSDILYGGAGEDILRGSDGNDTLHGGAGIDELYGDAGSDTLRGGDGNDVLEGGAWIDRLYGGKGDDVLNGGTGRDRLYGDAGNDELHGGTGTDYLYGGAGNDQLRGGAGFDYLYGGDGDDTYLFGRGDGNASILNNDAGEGRRDVLRFLAGINPDDVSARRSHNDLRLMVGSVDESSIEVITIDSFFKSSQYELDAVEFSDGTDTGTGTVWNSGKIKDLVFTPTETNDEIRGSDADDTIDGLGGSDQLYGGGGNDNLSGGAGHDILYGGGGNDNLSGGTDNDWLYGGDGDDELRGGTGNDTYFFGRGDGGAFIRNDDAGEGRKDVLRFSEGINPDDVRATRRSNDLQLTVQDGADESSIEVITVVNFFAGSRYAINAVEFSDGTDNAIGTVWDPAKLKELVLNITESADEIRGSDEDNIFDGLGGNDKLYGGDGKDRLLGGIGNDTLYGEDGDDHLYGNGDNDELRGGDGNDVLDGGADTDKLFGGAGNDELQGGTGSDDRLEGGAGDDTYLFGRGDGNTFIYNNDAGEDRKDVLRFLAGINPGDVTATRRDSDLQLTVQDGADESTVEVITVSGFFWRSSYAINAVEFSDGTDNAIGTVWDPAKLKLLVLNITEGADEIIGSDEDDVFDGLGGNDTLYGGDGDDHLYGNEDNDTLYGGDDNDVLDGGAGKDKLYGGEGNDELRGGTGVDDLLDGGAGDDTYLFDRGDGNTIIRNSDFGEGRKDVLRFLEGINPDDVTATRRDRDLQLTVQDGADESSIEVITVNGFFWGSSYEINTVEFSDGTGAKANTVWDASELKAKVLATTEGADEVRGSVTKDIFDGKGGDDQLYGSFGNDIISGGAGDDELYGEGDNDQLYGNADNDELRGGDGNDVLDGGAGIDELYGDEDDDELRGGTGDDQLYGAKGDDELYGGADNDELHGGDDDDVLDGGAGTDELYGGKGNDTLRGGTGLDDILEGGLGNDTYLFGRGDGNTIIENKLLFTTKEEEDAGKLRRDVLRFLSGISPSHVSAVRRNNPVMRRDTDLQLVVRGGDGDVVETITVNRFFAGTDYEINAVEFEDAPDIVWDASELKAQVLMGTSAADEIRGSEIDDTFDGLAGNDTLYGRDGKDTLIGGSGDDTLYGGDDDDVLEGGSDHDTLWGDDDNDQLWGGDGDDNLRGGDGHDDLYGGDGEDRLRGEDDDDTLWGGAGKDRLYGGLGNDTYLFGRGDGRTYIHNDDAVEGHKDILRFLSGINSGDVRASRTNVNKRSDNHLRLTVQNIDGSSELITVEKFFIGSQYEIDTIEFADAPGITWNTESLKIQVLLTDEDNDQNGHDKNDYLNGLGGDDTLHGGAGDDILRGGAGTDNLYGDAGNDTYLFGRGDGSTFIHNDDADIERTDDKLRFLSGINPEDVSVSRATAIDVSASRATSIDDLLLTVQGIGENSDEVITVVDFFAKNQLNNQYEINAVAFADGTVWNAETIKIQVLLTDGDNDQDGHEGDDYLDGLGGDDELRGGDGNDYLFGGAGNDELRGGAGTDVLSGGADDDSYLFGRGDGTTFIHNDDAGADRKDVLHFLADINPSDVKATRRDSDLQLAVASVDGSTVEVITVVNFFAGSQYEINAVEFSDGTDTDMATVWDIAKLKALVLLPTEGNDELYSDADTNIVRGGDGNDKLYGNDGNDELYGDGDNDELRGGDGNDVLEGGLGDDQLYGGEGNDELRGGSGNDKLYGGLGNDSYLFGRGDGNTAIHNDDAVEGRRDILRFVAGINPDHVKVTRRGSDLNLTVASVEENADQSTVEVITVNGFFSGSQYELNAVEFEDAPDIVWDVSKLKALVLTPTEGNDELYSDADTNIVRGGDGDDKLYGNDGNDELYGDGDNDELRGGDGNDVLEGGLGHDKLYGGAGADELYGGEGNDELHGGSGIDDVLDGGVGDDIYLFGRGDGGAFIQNDDVGEGRRDIVRFLQDINPDDVSAMRRGSDLQLAVASGEGSTDRNAVEVITVSRFFEGSQYELDGVEFSDGTDTDTGTIWDANKLKALVLVATEGDDEIRGSDGDEVFDGKGGHDTLYGGAGRDELRGGAGNDDLYGEADNDQLYGGSGNDELRGGAGYDRLHGESGDDTYLFGKEDGRAIIYNNDTGRGRKDVLRFLEGISPDDVIATRIKSSEAFYYPELNRFQFPRRGRDLQLRVLNADKSIIGAIDVIDFFSGSQYEINAIEFADAPDIVWNAFTLKALVLVPTATQASDEIIGLSGDDIIDALGGNDRLRGGSGNDRLSGGAGYDYVYGDAGNDHIYGNAGVDYLEGNAGDDVLDGGAGKDELRGGSGNDVIDGGAGDDSLYGSTGDDKLRGSTGDDSLYGSSGDDKLSGGSGNDLLYGDAENDELRGGAGRDKLYGGAGNDTLRGDAGEDKLYGGDGNDSYLFGRGDGSTFIYNDDDGEGRKDILRFLSGINPDDVRASRETDSDDLQLMVQSSDGNSSEVITVVDFFAGSQYALDAIEFEDAPDIVWNVETIKIQVTLTDGNDNQNGHEGDDYLHGLSGNDILRGGDGNDALEGGKGDDQLHGGSGDDQLRGGAGYDTLYGDAGNDSYLFDRGDGSTFIYNNDADAGRRDVLRFLAGINPSAVSASRATDSNDLQLTVQSSDNSSSEVITVVNFFAGSQYALNAVEFADGTVWNAETIKVQVLLTEGDDIQDGHAGDDYLNGLGGKDTLRGGAGNDTLRGGAGIDDYLDGGSGNDSYLFGRGDGNTTINNDDTSEGRRDILRFLTGINPSHVRVSRAIGSNDLHLTVQSSDGSSSELITVVDFFAGSQYALDAVEFADAPDIAWNADSLKRQVLLTEFADSQDGHEFDDYLDGLGGNDTLRGGAGNDRLHGGAGDDTLYGEAEDDSIYGDAGKDELYGGTGNDQLRGGTGTDDSLDGGAGDDTYLFGRGDGSTFIYNDDAGEGRKDILRFLAGINPGDVKASQATDSDDLLLTVENAGQRSEVITVVNFFAGSQYALDAVEFADAPDIVWNAETIKRQVLLTDGNDTQVGGHEFDDYLDGLAGNDELRGGDGHDRLYGGAGDDQLHGEAGDDVLYGGEDSDELHSGAGDDELYGGAGNDTLYGGAGNNTLYGEAGDDVLYGGVGENALYGGAGNDTLRGDAGESQLYGGAGDDSYLFGKRDGRTIINNNDSDEGRRDVLRFLEGINPDDVSVSRATSIDDLRLTVRSRGESRSEAVTVVNFFAGSQYELDAIEFADAPDTVWIADVLKSRVIFGATERRNVITGSTDNDTIYSLGGNDILRGEDGNDELYGGDGDDFLYGEDGNDTLIGGDGDDELYGDVGDDILRGGAGNDTLSGNVGDDSYLFGRGDGTTTINNNDADVDRRDVLRFLAGINPSDVIISRATDSDDLLLTVHSSDDSTDEIITVVRFFAENQLNGQYELNAVEFSDGTVWDANILKSIVKSGATHAGEKITGTDKNDIIYGLGGNDDIRGGAGDDQLHGGEGNDTLQGGAGEDKLYGGAGDDSYEFGRGDGTTTINNNDADEGSRDIVRFLEGINPSDVRASRATDSDDLRLTVQSIDESPDEIITVVKFFAGNQVNGQYELNKVEFEDSSTVWDADALKSIVKFGATHAGETIRGDVDDDNKNDIVYGLGGNDTLRGLDGNDQLYGGAGNDFLYGGEGDDTLRGGAGFDSLRGDAGNDTYEFGIGDLVTSIHNDDDGKNRRDILRFLEGINPGDITANANATSLWLNIGGYGSAGERFILRNFFSGSRYEIDAIEFEDGTGGAIETVWNSEDIAERFFTTKGTSSSDIMVGTSGIDTFNGLGSSDGLYGGDGDDVLRGGDGVDHIYGQNDNDVLYGDVGHDGLYGGEGDDELHGGIGHDVLNGDGDNDKLYGGSGNDGLSGQDGDDELYGGEGNDTLRGGSGNDSYHFSAGFGVDTIYNHDTSADSTDVARFDDSVSIEDLWFSRSSDDLQINMVGTNDQITIDQWYEGNDYQLDQFEVGSETSTSVLLNNQLDRLVTAMADYSVPSGVGSVVAEDVQEKLASTIAAVWKTS